MRRQLTGMSKQGANLDEDYDADGAAPGASEIRLADTEQRRERSNARPKTGMHGGPSR